jgi:UDP-GlcNAc3NAcA epimerase
MRLLSVIGARPQFVKAAVVSRAIRNANERQDGVLLEETVLHTGQHFDHLMSDIFLKEFNLKVDHNLEVQETTHGRMTARMLEGIEDHLLRLRPDMVILYGDTNSTLAGALAAAKLHIPVAHVEAGLRSYNMAMPEEINRIVADRLSTWLFCPTISAVENLQKEGIGISAGTEGSQTVHVVGDVMYDAFLAYTQSANALTPEVSTLLEECSGGFYLATVHRQENTNSEQRLRAIFTALNELAREHPVVLPLHPRTQKVLEEQKLDLGMVRTIDPVGYPDMLALLGRCKAVLTDSGGLQKEAFFMKKPCVTLREETEWVELVEGGYNVLGGATAEEILSATRRMCDQRMDWTAKPYGDGHAGDNIVDTLLQVRHP